MELALFISFAILLGLQAKNWKVVNGLAVLGTAVLAESGRPGLSLNGDRGVVTR